MTLALPSLHQMQYACINLACSLSKHDSFRMSADLSGLQKPVLWVDMFPGGDVLFIICFYPSLPLEGARAYKSLKIYPGRAETNCRCRWFAIFFRRKDEQMSPGKPGNHIQELHMKGISSTSRLFWNLLIYHLGQPSGIKPSNAKISVGKKCK